uniref:Uncharacterized protein n=1 Tax=Chromera velia CCMP2878 TaxID=1169474 RepID=A0A0G4HQ75_9ALVE|eukprot:Cvel_7890.t1-p1 / transcript=Cvel_7890.t1 / gene=Cvel_7890 / organism=Chromera_velia_CCMP2878 / gene_product=hypothetical protein / transcript_product=hypothetical protein / location=Cvel_scaffold423:23622-29122(-) / protein_length=404 / sequence_SO=supercontig / SO=protein_coding / is_pseudo=false
MTGFKQSLDFLVAHLVLRGWWFGAERLRGCVSVPFCSVEVRRMGLEFLEKCGEVSLPALLQSSANKGVHSTWWCFLRLESAAVFTLGDRCSWGGEEDSIGYNEETSCKSTEVMFQIWGRGGEGGGICRVLGFLGWFTRLWGDVARFFRYWFRREDDVPFPCQVIEGAPDCAGGGGVDEALPWGFSWRAPSSVLAGTRGASVSTWTGVLFSASATVFTFSAHAATGCLALSVPGIHSLLVLLLGDDCVRKGPLVELTGRGWMRDSSGCMGISVGVGVDVRKGWVGGVHRLLEILLGGGLLWRCQRGIRRALGGRLLLCIGGGGRECCGEGGGANFEKEKPGEGARGGTPIRFIGWEHCGWGGGGRGFGAASVSGVFGLLGDGDLSDYRWPVKSVLGRGDCRGMVG